MAFERRRSYDRSRASARPWLYGIALNVVRRHRRDQARRLRAYRSSGAAEALPDPGDEVVAVVDARALRPALFAALSRIAPRDREPLLLHCWEGVSYAEIAEALGVPVGTVRSRINRARRRLRALLEPQRRLSPAARR